jgi:hypothetical protein
MREESCIEIDERIGTRESDQGEGHDETEMIG